MNTLRALGLLLCGLFLMLATPASAQPATPEEATQAMQSCGDGRGDLSTCVDLSSFLYMGEGIAKDHATALRLARLTCDRGFPIGCANAGIILRFSDTVPHNERQALTLFQRGCDNATAPSGLACYQYAYMLLQGAAVTANEELARQKFGLACAARFGDACFEEGAIWHNRNNLANAKASYEAGCALNSILSCSELGHTLLNGIGVPIDAERGVKLFLQTCAQGNDVACNGLQRIRDGGAGTVGYAELQTLQAAETAFPSSLPAEQRFILASAAFEGGNVPLALTGFRALADGGLADAAFYLGRIYYEGAGVPQDQALAVRYFEQASDANHPYARYIMAWFYRNGHIVAYNELWSIALMRAAHEGGIAEAAIWRQWQDDNNNRFHASQAQMRADAEANERSERAAEAANMARIWSLYSGNQNQQGNGQVCGMVYRNNQANQECMARETYDRYYNPAYQ